MKDPLEGLLGTCRMPPKAGINVGFGVRGVFFCGPGGGGWFRVESFLGMA